MARFTRLPGSARRYLDTITGKEISRREYQQFMRGGTTNEQLAAINRSQNPIIAAARPAKGRKSALRASPQEREIIAQARIEDQLRRAALKDEAKKQREIEKLLAKRGSKKPKKRKRITLSLLQPGRIGRRVEFYTYEEYVEMFAEAKQGGKVLFYGLGAQGYHETTGKELDFTVFTMRTLTRPIDEDSFNEEMSEQIESRTYFVFTNYWMHLSFNKKFFKPKKKR